MSQQSQQVGKCHSKVTILENVRNILSETTVHMRQFGRNPQTTLLVGFGLLFDIPNERCSYSNQLMGHCQKIA